MSDITPVTTAVTMTSMELVEFVNTHRAEQAHAAGKRFPSRGFAKLEHADFMKKVPEVLGANAGNFSGIYRDTRNREQACFFFPKREACLMAMSYSYELQARVFDRMTALEASDAAPRIAYTQGPDDTLNAVEQEQLRLILTGAAESLPPAERGVFLQRGWSKLKAHFKVPYRQIPRREFTEALSIVARHASDAPALPVPADKALQQALDTMHTMAASVSSLAASVAALTAEARASPPQKKRSPISAN